MWGVKQSTENCRPLCTHRWTDIGFNVVVLASSPSPVDAVIHRQSIVPGKPPAPRTGATRGSRPQSGGLLYFRAQLQRPSECGDNAWGGETPVGVRLVRGPRNGELAAGRILEIDSRISVGRAKKAARGTANVEKSTAISLETVGKATGLVHSVAAAPDGDNAEEGREGRAHASRDTRGCPREAPRPLSPSRRCAGDSAVVQPKAVSTVVAGKHCAFHPTGRSTQTTGNAPVDHHHRTPWYFPLAGIPCNILCPPPIDHTCTVTPDRAELRIEGIGAKCSMGFLRPSSPGLEQHPAAGAADTTHEYDVDFSASVEYMGRDGEQRESQHVSCSEKANVSKSKENHPATGLKDFSPASKNRSPSSSPQHFRTTTDIDHRATATARDSFSRVLAQSTSADTHGDTTERVSNSTGDAAGRKAASAGPLRLSSATTIERAIVSEPALHGRPGRDQQLQDALRGVIDGVCSSSLRRSLSWPGGEKGATSTSAIQINPGRQKLGTTAVQECFSERGDGGFGDSVGGEAKQPRVPWSAHEVLLYVRDPSEQEPEFCNGRIVVRSDARLHPLYRWRREEGGGGGQRRGGHDAENDGEPAAQAMAVAGIGESWGGGSPGGIAGSAGQVIGENRPSMGTPFSR